jgi:hypothetical protein
MKINEAKKKITFQDIVDSINDLIVQLKEIRKRKGVAFEGTPEEGLLDSLEVLVKEYGQRAS